MGQEGEIDSKKTPASGEDAISAGTKTAEALEAAANNQDKIAFRNALDEVIAFRAGHTTEEFNQYMKAVRDKAKQDDMLPQLQIFANKTDFDIVDKNDNGKVERFERTAAAINNPLESELVKGIEDKSSFGVSEEDLNESMKAENTRREERMGLRDLFKGGENNSPSLYDKLKSGDGTVSESTINSFLDIAKVNADTLKLSKRDIEVLQWLKGQTDRLGPWNYISQKELAQICKDKGLDMTTLQAASSEKKKVDEPEVKSTNTDLPDKGNAPKVDGSSETGTSTGGKQKEAEKAPEQKAGEQNSSDQ